MQTTNIHHPRRLQHPSPPKKHSHSGKPLVNFTISQIPLAPTSHAVSRLASVMHSMTEVHWGQLRYLLKYLKGSIKHNILYNSNAFQQLVTYANAGLANSNEKNSHTSIIHILTHSPIMWQSRKQKTIAMSTCEAEFLSTSSAAQQSLRLQQLLYYMGHIRIGAPPLPIDNHAAIQVARQTCLTKHRKYIDLR